jgi:hypothetical protein
MPENGRTLYASLIGINEYEGEVKPLRGCVKDILLVDAFLRDFCDQQHPPIGYKPLFLLSPDASAKKELENYRECLNLDLNYSAPTFQNVTKSAFSHLEQADNSRKDMCLFYFSGHGAITSDVPIGFETKKIETLVCKDSRNGARDLRDKEIAFLLHKVLDSKPHVHCLVITDCCHGGGVTRGAYQGYRSIENGDRGATLEEYLGFKEGFYKRLGNKLVFPIADYVHLAACTADQKALDWEDGGHFSKALLKLLTDGASDYSYRIINGKLAATMSILHYRQTPVAFSRGDWKLDQTFLGEGLVPFTRSFELRYNTERNRWQLNAGLIHGLVPSRDGGKTRIRVVGTNIEVNLTAVELTRSIVGGDGLKQLDTSNDSYSATLVSLAIQPMRMDLSRLDEGMKWELKEAYKKQRPLYVQPFDEFKGFSDFQVFKEEQGFSLEGHPYLSPRSNAKEFLEDVEAMARWAYFRKLNGSLSQFSAEDFEFKVERIEGQTFINSKSLDRTSGTTTTISPNTGFDLSYKDGQPPAFRFSIKFRGNPHQEECFVAALYFGSEFGIYTDFLATGCRLSEENTLIQLSYRDSESSLTYAIPLKVHPAFFKDGIERVDEYLKIIIADKPIDLSTICQPDLILDKSEVMRSHKDSKSRKAKEELNITVFLEPFAVFDFPVRLCRQL